MNVTPSHMQKQSTYSSWEFLPGFVLDFPVYCMGLFLAIKSGHPLFFSNVNPGMVSSGLVEVSKYDTLKQFPTENIPLGFLVSTSMPLDTIHTHMQEIGISYPIILKPNSSGRNGNNVKKALSDNDLMQYVASANTTHDILLQECRDDACEFGIFYYRMPGEETGHITGITSKEFLAVTGDAQHTLSELVDAHPRARRYSKTFHAMHRDIRNTILPAGEKLQLSYIGNHCKGSVFYDMSDHITPELTTTIDRISKSIAGFYCGRYDLKAASIEAVARGECKILELNGIISEPTWIYDPKHSRGYAIKETRKHWKLMYQISQANLARGIRPIRLREARKLIQQYGI